jgi:PAP2 superfamily
MQLNSENYLRLLRSIGTVACVLWLACWHSFYADTISSSFLSVALLSLLVILLRTRFSIAELSGVGVLVGVFAMLDLWWLRYPGGWQVWVSFLGLASLAVLALRVVWNDGENRRTAWFTLIPAFLFVASEWCADYFLAWTEHAHPKVLDLYLYSFDASLYAQLPFLMGQLFAGSLFFAFTSLLFYLGLPLVIGLTFAGCVVTDKRIALSAFLAFFLTGPVGACFYNLLPAMGPVHIFERSFPWHPLSIEQASRLFLEPVAGHGARNAIPSLHAAWVFLALWYARKLSLVERIVAIMFAIFTLFATLGLGEHYFVDLVVALPFSLFMVSLGSLLAERDRRRMFPLLMGLGITLLWFVALRFATRFFWISPVLPWLASLITVVLSIYGLRLLTPTATASEPGHSAFEEVASGLRS